MNAADKLEPARFADEPVPWRPTWLRRAPRRSGGGGAGVRLRRGGLCLAPAKATAGAAATTVPWLLAGAGVTAAALGLWTFVQPCGTDATRRGARGGSPFRAATAPPRALRRDGARPARVCIAGAGSSISPTA